MFTAIQRIMNVLNIDNYSISQTTTQLVSSVVVSSKKKKQDIIKHSNLISISCGGQATEDQLNEFITVSDKTMIEYIEQYNSILLFVNISVTSEELKQKLITQIMLFNRIKRLNISYEILKSTRSLFLAPFNVIIDHAMKETQINYVPIHYIET
jgi:hypothetical protein